MASDVENDADSASNSPDDSGDQEMADNDQEDHSKLADDEEVKREQKKANLKDPSRPRRKKARRACFACQRAHLTCGDERPCQRCIKRGLQDACQDGVRKKAKYLHDAPNEALLPGAGEHYQYLRNVQAQQQQSPPSPSYGIPQSMSESFVARRTSGTMPSYAQASTAGQLSLADNSISSSGFVPQQSPINAPFQDVTTLAPNIGGMIRSVNSGTSSGNIQDFGGNIFDGSDLSQYNFDPASFNFGNHYGALEFGILGQMATGAAETPPSDHTASLGRADSIMSSAGGMASAYAESPMGPGYIFGQDQTMNDWRTPTQPQSNIRTRPATAYNLNGMKQEQPNAFSIGTNSAFASPTSEMSPAASKNMEEAPPKMLFGQASAPNSRPSTRAGRQMGNPSQQLQQNVASAFVPTSRRRGDPSQVYRTVTQPYSYTTGFHSLTAFLQKRFSSQQTLRIAKSLASIRPSFLACTKSLGYEDLIFMEKCFQRTLWEYEDFINATGTPTIVCRRTGEVAAVGKEFSILTGWKKDVLLGREANLNVNRGTATANSTNASSTPTRGTGTPRLPEGVIEGSNRPQPVFLAELLDDESVIEFYEDFARLAFGDSHGTITTRCKLLKYRTKDSKTLSGSTGITNLANTDESASRPSAKRKRPGAAGRREDIAGEARIDELGDKDGKVECSCCWTVKRDLFDLPMMIVMNFLPCI